MTTLTILGAQTTLQTITNTFDTWVISSGCTITVASGNAIADTASIANQILEIAGGVTANAASGASLQGDNYDIIVDATGTVTAKYGFVLSGSGSTLTNNGAISGSSDGIYENGGSNTIINNASLSGGFGVELLGVGTKLVNGVDGIIDGTSLPVWFGNSTGKTSFVNEGLVKGAFQSIGGDAGQTTITNSGEIRAAIYLGDGNDTFINKGGICSGLIDLGNGDVITLDGIAMAKITSADFLF